MGAYLSEPIREKVSIDGRQDSLPYGASSMQGWRVSQEDSHNCCPDFDPETKTSLFAVYDGHGGAEVAQYTAIHYPEYLKTLQTYKDGKLASALEESFLGFDDSLTQEKVIQELKEIAGVNPDEDEIDPKSEAGREEAATLYEEATMPLDQVLERYGYAPGTKKIPPHLRKDEKFQSPVIRAKADSEGSKDNDSNEASPTKPDDGIKMKLDAQLLNGHSENENNENMEKERAGFETKKSAQDTVVDSTTKDVITRTKNNDLAATNEAEATIKSSDTDSNETIKTNGEKSAPVTSTDDKPSSSTPEPTSGGSKESPSSSSTPEPASGGSKESPSSSNTAGSSSSGSSAEPAKCSDEVTSGKPENAAPSSSKSDDTEAGCSAGKADAGNEDDLDDSEDEDEWETSDEEDMEDMPGSEDEDDDMEDDDGEEEVMCGGEEPGSDSGCTAVVAVLRGRDLFVANAGDSRCVVCREGKAVDMSVDHKPEDDLERNRIEAAGGKVTADGRVNGGLNLSRAIGDHCYKKNKDLSNREFMITALPDVRCVTLDEKDKFMVLACDGIWNAMTSQDVVNFVSQRMEHGVENLSTICEEMFEFCLAPDTSGDGTGCDNMTAIIVKLDKLNVLKCGAANKRPAATEEVSKDSKDSPNEGQPPDNKKSKSAEDQTSTEVENTESGENKSENEQKDGKTDEKKSDS